MNDTEAEARRLLAAATEDMPPGIDLLDGFTAARRRHRVRRTQGRAALAAGIAVVAATVTAVTLTVGSAPPALAAISTAVNRALAQSYHLTDQEGEYYIYGGRIHSPSHGTCTEVADPVRHLEADSCGIFADREVGGYTYMYSPDNSHPGRHWWRTPTSSILHLSSPGIGGVIRDEPQQILSAIKKAATIIVAEPASGPGWTGTRYAFSSFTPSPFKLKGAPPDMGEKTTGYVDVDRQGRARALVMTTRDTGPMNVFVHTETLTFSDFGARVTVVPPPADQTFTGP